MIRGDISRTFPEEDLFKANNGSEYFLINSKFSIFFYFLRVSILAEMLFNVMKAYAVSDPEVGYCQGSAFIAGMLLLHMPEEDAFSVLVKLLSKGTGYVNFEKHLLRNFSVDRAGIKICGFGADL